MNPDLIEWLKEKSASDSSYGAMYEQAAKRIEELELKNAMLLTGNSVRVKNLERAARMALEMLDLCNKNGWMLADYEGQMYEALTALREVLWEKK